MPVERQASTEPFDVVAIGRSGVDVYPLQTGVGLEDVDTFGKFLGGSAANVAVAAARLGNRTALISGVGDDPFGRFVRAELARLGVDNRFVTVHGEYPTPVTFCEIFPPDDFPLYFYRKPSAPDLQIQPDGTRRRRDPGRPPVLVDGDGAVRGAEPQCTLRSLGGTRGLRELPALTVLDLDYRPMFWESPAAATEQVQRALGHVTVAVGNREECEIAVGESNPRKAADALLDLGVELAIVKQGPRGVLGKTRTQLGHRTAQRRSTSSTASAPETASAAASFTAYCAAGRWRRPCATPTPRVPSWHPGSNARPPCRPPPRSPSWPNRSPWRPSMSKPTCKDYTDVTDLRAADPGAVAKAWDARTTRPTVRATAG